MRWRTPAILGCGLLVGWALGWWAGPALLFETVQPPLAFSHVVHTEEAGMACADCHGLDPDRAIALPTTSDCALCHESVLGESEAERRLVEEFVVPGRPLVWTASLEQPEGVRFSHAQHVELASLDCEACHAPRGASTDGRGVPLNRISAYPRALWGRDAVGPDPRGAMEMSDCVDCHRHEAVVQSCLDCHR